MCGTGGYTYYHIWQVPIIIELKRHLEAERSPLLRDVFLFLRELLKDHKPHLQV